MLSLSRKLDSNLLYYLTNNVYLQYRVLIKYKRFEESIVKKIISHKGKVLYKINSIKIISAEMNEKSIKYLIEYPEIEKIYLDEYLFIHDLITSSSNHKSLINNSKYSGFGVGIGIVDSGIYPHKDLISKQKISLFVDLINNFQYPYDDNGHGTCICGILSSNENNTFKGICPNSKLFCYKAFDKLGKGFASTILFAINELINISQENNIKLLCLPFELISNNSYIRSLFESIFNLAISKGLIPIVPASSVGNENFPLGISTLNNCITVGGLTASGISPILYKYSPPNSVKKINKPNLLAVCDNIISLNSDLNYISQKSNGIKLYPHKLQVAYKTFSGLSIASAYICGICALICEKEPQVTFNDMLSLLKVSCTYCDNIDKSFQGFGAVDIKKLIN